MSESGNRNDSPADRQPDKDQIIQELKDMKVYEEGLTVKEMTELLQVLKDTMPESQNSETYKTPEKHQLVRQPSNSQSGNANSSMTILRRSLSPELPSGQHNSFASLENGTDSAEESMFSTRCRNPFDKNKGKESKDASTNANKARNAINDNTIEPANENKRMNTRTNSQLKSEDRIARWKFNPLDVAPNERDKPLISRFHGLSNRECAGNKTLDDINKDIAKMSLHLQKVSDVCRSQRRSDVQSNSPWGTAIKVGTANGSLDVEAIADEATEEVEASDAPDENVINEIANSRRRRACVQKVDPKAYKEADNNDSEDEFETRQKKRKPATLDEPNEKSRSSKDSLGTNLNQIIENSKRPKCPVRDDEYHWGDEFLGSSDEDSAEKPTRRKKAKLSNVKKPTQSSSKNKSVDLVSTDDSKDNSIEKEAEQISIDDSDEVTICESATAGQSRNRLKRSESPEATSSVYPRRIPPPNPRGKYSALRARKPLHPNPFRTNKRDEQDNEDDAEVARTLSRTRGKAGLQDDEIVEQLENDEEIEGFALVEPSPIVPLRPSSRLRQQTERLRAEKQKEAEAESIKREAERMREEETSRRKIERVKERVKEEAEKVKLAEQNERRKLAAEKTWRERMRSKEKQWQTERIELNPEGPRQAGDVPSVEVVPENHFETERGNHSQPEQLTCPICSKDFPVEEIENHAATCETYDASSSAGRSRSNSPAILRSLRNPKQRNEPSKLWTCDTCSKFTARNGKEFEDHVHSCIARLKNGVDDGAGSIVAVPDSPIRTVRKNSEQTDSEINYADQLHAPKTRSNFNPFGKRKRR